MPRRCIQWQRPFWPCHLAFQLGRRRTAGPSPAFLAGKSCAWTVLFSRQEDSMELVKVRTFSPPITNSTDGFAGVFLDECAGIGLVGSAADVLEAPMEGLNAAIVVGGPAAVLVAADFAFEPVHEKSQQFTVYSQKQEDKKSDRSRNGSRRISTKRTQREESVRDGARRKGD